MKENKPRIERLGKQIKKLRKEKGWTQKELSDKLEVSSQVISNWEREYTYPDHEEIGKLANVFNVSSDEILGYETPSVTLNYDLEELKNLFDHFRFLDSEDEELFEKVYKIKKLYSEEFFSELIEGKPSLENVLKLNKLTFNNQILSSKQKEKLRNIIEIILK